LIKAFYLSKNAKQILPLHFVEIIIRQSDWIIFQDWYLHAAVNYLKTLKHLYA
jgi:hypothetical protein